MLIIECFPSQVVRFYAGQTHEIKENLLKGRIIFDMLFIYL